MAPCIKTSLNVTPQNLHPHLLLSLPGYSLTQLSIFDTRKYSALVSILKKFVYWIYLYSEFYTNVTVYKTVHPEIYYTRNANSKAQRHVLLVTNQRTLKDYIITDHKTIWNKSKELWFVFISIKKKKSCYIINSIWSQVSSDISTHFVGRHVYTPPQTLSGRM